MAWLGNYNVCKILKILYFIKKSDLQNFVSICFFVSLTYIKLLILFMLPFFVSHLACSRYSVIPQSWHAIISSLSPSKTRQLKILEKKLLGRVRRF